MNTLRPEAAKESTRSASVEIQHFVKRENIIMRGLKNASLAGRDEFPKTVTEAYKYLSKWEGYDTSARAARGFEGVAFANDTREPQPDTREPQDWHEKMTCRKCKKVGKVSNTNVQDEETHVTNKEAVLELMVAEQEGAN
jgi:hypothetical protein